MKVRYTPPQPRDAARVERAVGDPLGGDPLVARLPDLWRHLESSPRLGGYFTIHRWIEWASAQNNAWSKEARAGHGHGLHTARDARQFTLQNPVLVDYRQPQPRRAATLPWDRVKLVVNAAPWGAKPWRIAAALDEGGLVCSRQFFGLWPKRQVADAQLLAFVAILNGPVANEFLAAHSPAKSIRIAAMKDVPVPPVLPSHAAELVVDYVRRLRESESTGSDDGMEELLTRIDAAVLGAYDLPARLEQQLLDCFRDSVRPVGHAWRHWDERNPAPGLTLAERVSGRFRPHGSWILDVFQPLPADGAELLATYGA